MEKRRTAVDGVNTQRVYVTLDKETISFARQMGNGNVSLGIRFVMKKFKKYIGGSVEKAVDKILNEVSRNNLNR